MYKSNETNKEKDENEDKKTANLIKGKQYEAES